MRKIEIDDEVYALLQRYARPFEDRENDVLRRLLFADDASFEPKAASRPGDLLPYLDAGLLEVGDELVHEQPRKGRVHRGTVTPDGGIKVGGEVYPKVSPALKAVVGHEINGWGQWVLTRTGQRLQDVREELRRRESDESAA
ncbi:hypothetical protein GCM10023328_28020 [Modestobacter marinus]|uniref:RAMA domain-containing protein n=1 Tax=Modestobacter marinus TaxID=477641 RepID=A0A846LR94_9ACTN|nr:hypothetical protein [Modestobacter marinus]NIH69917.1 hypothetical protein [Modestobacter marinus]GGL80587.1 hypothetical protein GCM10011589_41060 [Modestobacter marinus]